jgi:hypothetical protein
LTNASVLGQAGLQLESTTNPGEVLVLPLTAISALPASLTTALSAITGASTFAGWRLHIFVTGNTASGTITILGKDFSQALNAVSESTPTIPIAGTGSNLLSTGYEYVTQNILSSVNAAGVTLGGGLTGGAVKIYAVAAVRSLQPMLFDVPEEKIPPFSPVEQRGLRSRNTNIQRLNKTVDVPKLEQVFYPDTLNWWWPRMAIGAAPAQVTVPATPTVLHATYAVAGGAMSLTTQPNTLGPGQLIQLIVTGSSAVGTVIIAGTNIYGQAITETVQCGIPAAANGNGTFYTQQVFATVGAGGVTFTGLTSGSVAFNGLTASQETYTRSSGGAGDTLASASLELFDGVDTSVLPYTFLEETLFEWAADAKEVKVTGKGGAQNMLAVGDRTTTPMFARARASQIGAVGAFASSAANNPAAGLWQPFDVGLSGWQTAVFIDPMSGSAGTTAYNQVLDGKMTFKTPQKRSFPSVNLQWFQKLYLQQSETELEFVVDFIDLVQYEMFRQNVEQQVQVQFIGPYLGSTGGTVYNKLWKFTFNAHLIETKRDASKMEKVEARLKYLCRYDVTLGYEFQLVIINTLPPNYAS